MEGMCIIIAVHPTTCHVTVWTKQGLRTPGARGVVAEQMLPEAAHFARRRLEEQELENLRIARGTEPLRYTVIPVSNGEP